MRVAAINQKGGVGKTTTAVNLASGLEMFGKSVLLVDMDSQANCTSTFLAPTQIKASLYDALASPYIDLDICIYQVRENIHILPAPPKMGLARIQNLLMDTYTALQDTLDELPYNFDIIIIDSPPSAGPLFFNAMGAADEVIIPVRMGIKDYEGTGDMMEVAGSMNARVSGILPTFYDERRRIDRGIMALLERHYVDILLDPIRENTALGLAFGKKQSIFEYNAGAKGAKDYLSLVARYA